MSSSDIIQKERPSTCFHRYWEAVFIVVQKEILRVFLWLYEGGSEHVRDYLKTKPRGMKRLGAMEKKALMNRENPALFDITLLYNIIQHVCGLVDDNADMWHDPSTPEEENSLEHTLFMLKKKRNLLSHKPHLLIHMTQDDLEAHFTDLRQMCDLIIREAGQRANKPTDEIDRCVANMKKNLEDINTKPSPSGFTAKKFALVAKQEMVRKHNPSPSSNTFVLPLIHTSSKSGRYERSLKNFPVWRCDDGSFPEATALQGETGSGKSAISKYVFDSWISNDESIINELIDFDLVLPVQCCNVSTRDLIGLLKDFLEDTISLCDSYEIISFLGKLRILWLVDGFEEATKDAVEILKCIEGLQTSSTSPHLLFITTHPQKHQDLLSEVSISSDNICMGVLIGLSPEGVRNFVENQLHLTENDLSKCQIRSMKFHEDITAQSMDLVEELKIPLKLKLILDLWIDGKLQPCSGASLKHLYDSLMDANKEKLQEKIQKKYSIRKDVIESRISSWIEVLSEVAFKMSMQKKFIKISNYFKNKLEKAADGVIDPEQCLSTFLQPNGISPSSDQSYSFLHGSQQFHLSAKHIVCLMKKKKPNQVLKELLKPKLSNEDPKQRYHYYQILLQVVSSVALHHNLQQSTASILVDLISMCPGADVFEVVQYADYSPMITKAVSKLSPKIWLLGDRKIKAAHELLQFTAPSVMVIDISADPKGLQELPEFLRTVSMRNVEITLHFWNHYNVIIPKSPSSYVTSDSSDRYLTSIFSSEAKCHLCGFCGSLSLNGIQDLRKKKELMLLCLKVATNEILRSIINNEKYSSRDELLLTLTMPVITTPMPSLESTFKPIIQKPFINLPLLDESRVEETSLALTQISKNYDAIILYDISASAAVKFIKILEEKKVKVRSITKMLIYQHSGTTGDITVNFGPVPLDRSVDVFYDQWSKTRLEMNEDELGITIERLIIDGISPSSVAYVEGTSLLTASITRFR